MFHSTKNLERVDASTGPHAMHVNLHVGSVKPLSSETLTRIPVNASFYKKSLAGGCEHDTPRKACQFTRPTSQAAVLPSP